MSKIKLNNVTNPSNVTVMNDNFQKIEDELNEKVLYRKVPTGEPNQMSNDLDMNGKHIYNLPVPTEDHEPARVKDLKDKVVGGDYQRVLRVPNGVVKELGSAIERSNKFLSFDAQGNPQTVIENGTFPDITRRLDHAILQYDTLAEAEEAAKTLPDGQVVDVEAIHLRHTVFFGALTNPRPVTEAQVSGGISRTAEEAFKDAANIFGFGAKGDDSSDDEQAFKDADASPYSIIYVPDGVYRINSYIPTKQYFGPGKMRITSAALRSFDSVPQVPNYNEPNTTVGANATRRGRLNTIYGYNVGGNFNDEAFNNALFGHNLASGDTIEPETNLPFSGNNNNGFGFHALKANQTGSSNNAFGGDALNQNKTGNHNAAFGQAAGQQVINSSDNCFFGSSSGLRTEDGHRVSYFGRNAGRENKSGIENAVFGWSAGSGVTYPPTNAIGDGATKTFVVNGGYTFTSTKQVRVDVNGKNILPANYTVSGSSVSFLVAPASGSSIVFTPTIGAASYSYCSVFGARAGQSLKSGSHNVLFGHSTGNALSVGSNNTIIGSLAAVALEGSGNIIIGNRALNSVATANNRIAISNHSSGPFIDGICEGASNVNNYLRLDANFSPSVDASRTNGTALRRWQLFFAETGTINTSDGREKSAPKVITDEVLDAWGDVQLVSFQWLSSIIEKGEDIARWHFGLIAQQVRDAFSARGLDGTRFGLLCYDEWPAEEEEWGFEGSVIDENGMATSDCKKVLIKAAVPSGNRWGIRADQCLFLEAAYQRRRADRIEERLLDIETKLNIKAA